MLYEIFIRNIEKYICEGCSLGNNLQECQPAHKSSPLLCHCLTCGKPNSLSAHQVWDDYILFPPTLSLRSPLALAAFCSLHSANWSGRCHFPPFCLNFSPRQASLFHYIRRLQSAQHREADGATTSLCMFFKKKAKKKANNQIAGWSDSLPCSPVPSDQLSQVMIQKVEHFTLQ